MRNTVVKMILLLLFVSTTTAFGQNTDIRCEVRGLDFNLSQHDPRYLIDFGSFSLFADGEKVKEEKGAVLITKFYKLPRTKLILSVFVGYTPKGGQFGDQVIAQQMFLGKKRFPITSPKFDEEKMMKEVVSATTAGYPIKAFDKGGEGLLSMPFLGKKEPIQIIMRCKKVDK